VTGPGPGRLDPGNEGSIQEMRTPVILLGFLILKDKNPHSGGASFSSATGNIKNS
jgi:hypothetical protein